MSCDCVDCRSKWISGSLCACTRAPNRTKWSIRAKVQRKSSRTFNFGALKDAQLKKNPSNSENQQSRSTRDYTLTGFTKPAEDLGNAERGNDRIAKRTNRQEFHVFHRRRIRKCIAYSARMRRISREFNSAVQSSLYGIWHDRPKSIRIKGHTHRSQSNHAPNTKRSTC